MATTTLKVRVADSAGEVRAHHASDAISARKGPLRGIPDQESLPKALHEAKSRVLPDIAERVVDDARQ